MLKSSIQFSVGNGIKYLLLINLGIHVLMFVSGKLFGEPFEDQIRGFFRLSPLIFATFPEKFYIWKGLTYLFGHQGNLHLVFNLFILWMFGMDLEARWGTKPFLKFYLTCGFLAGVTWAYANFLLLPPLDAATLDVLQSNPGGVIGASGAVYAVLTAYALTYPNRTVLFMFFIPMRMMTLVILMALVDLALGISGAATGMAHFVHILGMIYAYIYVRWGWKIEETYAPARDFFLGLFRIQKRNKIQIKIHKDEGNAVQSMTREEIDARVDELLEKINKSGASSLTAEEKEFLDYASKLYSEKD